MPMISYVYLLVLITSTAASSSSSSSSLLISHDEECLALFQFKQTTLHQDYITTSFNGFQKLDSCRRPTISNMSDNGSDCCLWDGVVCSRNEGHVIELDLSQSAIHGPLTSNSTLFNLVHLLKLNLSKNNFADSQIPPEIARLKKLRSLDLSDSGFSGKVPNKISHLIWLSLLDLSLNSLKLQTPSLLQNLTRLDKLHLSQVNISSSVPRFLANFSSLTSINFQDCHLQGKFPAAILHLPNLKYLNLKLNPDLSGSLPEFHNNSLLEYLNLYTTSFFGIIPESISKLNHLEFLALVDSFFSGSIPGSLSNLTQLTFLSLRKNNFTGPVPSLASLSKLTVLEFSHNNFEKGCKYEWIGKLTNLDELYLNRNNIYHEILPSLANLTKLQVVSVVGNFIPGRIPSSFMNLTQLTRIDLHNNTLNGPIPSAFSNFKTLNKLALADNNFIGSVDLDTFMGLKNLEELHLSGISVVTTDNYTDGTLPALKQLQLSSCELKEFPAFLRFQNKMIGFDLDNNEIGGVIPSWILNNNHETMLYIDLSYNLISGFPLFLPWVHLESFFIVDNQLRGKLPIPPKTTLYYDVSGNKMIGEIPPLICQAESLRLLDLSSNSLNGTIPTCLVNFSNPLLSLNLKRNKFHGKFPNTFTDKSQLKMIDLSENQFSGPLPKSLANCNNLEVLSIGDNSFDGVFPFWLGTLTELQVLILRANKFASAIQDLSTFSAEFPKLRILDLSNNGFSGRLPDKYFKIWKAMKSVYSSNSSTMGFEISFYTFLPSEVPYSMTLTNKGVKTEYPKILNIFTAIDLSCNSFEGDIPQSLTDLQGLQSLNLSNNHLTGYVLSSLGNLKNLESLDLSRNNLSGEIPQELLQLGFLSMFNVSFNHLKGRIPTKEQFNTFENNSYVGNPLLCGKPLSNDCLGSTTSTHLNTIDEYESLLPSDIIDWVVVFSGCGSGLVIGILLGNFLYGRYHDWFIERFGMRKDTWVRPLGHQRRN
ncbi:receptor-like protein 6 [Rutidosis leptorrhynchoides]|uniref:receptor-like protein 6 n=1 Tax=Rutidosis leptorrhynchoides TaxID=125765 RepID=UPI003A99E941